MLRLEAILLVALLPNERLNQKLKNRLFSSLQTGLIAGAPHILLMGFSYGLGCLSDWLLKSGRMTRTGVRKLAITMCTSVQAAFTVGLSLSGCQSTLAVLFMLMGTMVTRGISAGTVANLVDLRPNFSSILLGICGLTGLMEWVLFRR